jgi:hypothetical protein
MYWHLSSFAKIIHIAGKLMSHLLNGESSPQECTCLTILRENHVNVLDSSSTSNTGGLFT